MGRPSIPPSPRPTRSPPAGRGRPQLLRRGDRTGCCSGQLDVGLRLRALNALPVLGRLVIDHVNPGLFLLLHAYSGYGESLIDYDRPVHTVGLGIAFR